jgi:hypothetical protein
MPRITRKEWEGKPQDKAADRKGAKKLGESARKYEGSKADRKADAKGMKKLTASREKRKAK